MGGTEVPWPEAQSFAVGAQALRLCGHAEDHPAFSALLLQFAPCPPPPSAPPFKLWDLSKQEAAPLRQLTWAL